MLRRHDESHHNFEVSKHPSSAEEGWLRAQAEVAKLHCSRRRGGAGQTNHFLANATPAASLDAHPSQPSRGVRNMIRTDVEHSAGLKP
jgi:hypothetical protein